MDIVHTIALTMGAAWASGIKRVLCYIGSLFGWCDPTRTDRPAPAVETPPNQSEPRADHQPSK